MPKKKGKTDQRSSMPLHKESSIQLRTPLGTSEVQLLLGDITDLQPEDGVDIIMVSAFPGDYSITIKRTLIGSLFYKFKLSVEALANDKEFDMRSNFYCWVSRPLKKHIPYRRLVCFERGRRLDSGSIAQQISVFFRALTPIFNNEETTVITPLLATGNQGNSPVSVLHAMVEGACHWIKAGLPLRCLKLVIYASDPDSLSARDREAVEEFQRLKSKWEATNQQQIEEILKNDVYISYSNHDNSLAEMVDSHLCQIRPDLQVYKTPIVFSSEDVWQEGVFHVMMQSKKIIIILSPSYVKSPECLEQFNMALCIIRVSHNHQVYPLYVETVIPSLPSYMQLMQYVECRERKEGEATLDLIRQACVTILTVTTEESLVTKKEDSKKVTANDVKYDVFISYAHRNPDSAENMLKYLQELDPGLNVFFDRSELKTGSSWQQSLYNAMDSAQCVVALLSPAYVQSVVCKEEFNIALNRMLAGSDVCIVPVIVESLETLPQSFSYVPTVDALSMPQLKDIAHDIVSYVRKGKKIKGISKPSLTINPAVAQEVRRSLEFDKSFHRREKEVQRKSMVKDKTNSVFARKATCDIVFSFSHDSLRIALILSELIHRQSPTTTCKFISENNKDRLNVLDQSSLVILLVSDGYVKSAQLLEELHLSLCRQRRETSTCVLYLIQAKHQSETPVYLHFLPYAVGIHDRLWASLAQKNPSKVDQLFKVTRDGIAGSYTCSLAERLALSKASVDILHILINRPGGEDIVRMNILNMGDVNKLNGGKDKKYLKKKRPVSPEERKSPDLSPKHTIHYDTFLRDSPGRSSPKPSRSPKHVSSEKKTQSSLCQIL